MRVCSFRWLWGVVVVSRVCRLQPGVKAALIRIERFMEGVSGVTDVN